MPEGKYTTPEQIEEMRRAITHAKEITGSRLSRKRRRRSKASRARLAAKVAGWLLFIASFVLLTIVLISVNVAKSKGETPSVLGFYLYRVESGSMDPTLPVGTVILSRKPHDARALQVKDIVTFNTLSGSTVTHRIVEVLIDNESNVSYRTKGDNPINSIDVELLAPERVIAVFLMKIPFT